MAGPALEHAFRYRFASTVDTQGATTRLRLATSEPEGQASPHLSGMLRHPRRAADGLLLLARVARTRFHIAPSTLVGLLRSADPVVSVQADALRFEALSACTGVYARLDLRPESLEPDALSPGCTNVDLHGEMRALLARVDDRTPLRLRVGHEGIALESGAVSVEERRVGLALRWLTAFGNSQAIAASMRRVAQVSGPSARRLLAQVPKTRTRGDAYVRATGDALRIARQPQGDTLRVGAIERLALLAEVAHDAHALALYEGRAGSSAFVLRWPDACFTVMLSPERYRGFAGEGALLDDLARDDDTALARVRATLTWGALVDPAALERTLNCTRDAVSQALATLASNGLLGFDLHEARYFTRALPYRLEVAARTHPRLEAARALVARGAVTLERRESNPEGEPAVLVASVRASDGDGAYRVRAERAHWSCTCPWYGRHEGDRGPCKHVLAVQLTLDAHEPGDEQSSAP